MVFEIHLFFLRTLNVSIKMDEDPQPVEVPKKTTRPMNRFSSPVFSDKLMSDLGSVLNKKKSPLGKVRQLVFNERRYPVFSESLA